MTLETPPLADLGRLLDNVRAARKTEAGKMKITITFHAVEGGATRLGTLDGTVSDHLLTTVRRWLVQREKELVDQIKEAL
jgi:hypothetical protein